MVSLATVAISALAGPLGAVGVAAATELVKTCQAAWDRNSPQRQLRDAVQQSIETWAKHQEIPSETIDRGLGWAVEWVQAAGSQYDLIAEADFDPDRATVAVLDQIKRSEGRYYGTEDEYTVAERAVAATYRAMCNQLKSDGGTVLAAIQATRHAIVASIEGLRAELKGYADRDELIRYLRARIREWDFSPWTQGKSPSLLERTLQLNTDGTGKLLPASDALTGAWFLVVLGGPGSGKTWLAQRYAREAAGAALTQLQDPRVDPASVEIPLFTTCAAWAAQPGGGIDALAAAALPSAREERIRRSVLRPGARVLAVADSLDEAGISTNAARTLVRSLTWSPGLRVVLTSRLEAWHTTAAALTTDEDMRIGTLVELQYPDDVRGYIRQWFPDEPASADHLIDQLDDRKELRDTATVPLLLTFFCMLTEQEPNQPLPWRRRDLYRSVIDLLLTRRWSDTTTEPDLKACQGMLQVWAWEAVRDAVTPVGLGAWPDTFTTGPAAKALDSVAPKEKYPTHSKYDHTHVERRFLHRTLLEHSVAEYIATLPATQAADELLPHVWFDPEWAVTTPMAIAAHPHRDQVLDLLWAHHIAAPTPAQEIANNGLETLVLHVAAQTLPSDWNANHRGLIHGLRVQAAPRNPRIVGESARWTSSNAHAVQAILDALPDANPVAVRDLVGALPALVVTDTDRAHARQAILDALPDADPVAVRRLVDALPALDPTDTDRAQARQAILDALPDADPVAVRDLVDALRSLAPVLEWLGLLASPPHR